MGVERRLHLLGMNLGAADVDDSAAPTEKKQPVAATLHHISGVDETLFARELRRAGAQKAQRPTIRTQVQRAVDYLHPNGAVVVEPACGKTGLAVIDGEGDASLSRGIRMLDARAGIERLQGGEHGGVRYFARQSDIRRMYPARLLPHQHLSPMRRRAGNVRDAGATEADQERIDAFVGAA